MRHALRRDLDAIVDVWVDAFSADPYLRWIQPDDAGWPAYATAWMGLIAERCLDRGNTFVDGDPIGVAIAWIPPDLSLVGPDDMATAHSIIATTADPARADDALATIVAARAHLLEDPHWTLQYIGVRSGARATGAGARAVAPMLATCDAEGLPCALVSTNPRNLTFYERHGFRVTGEVPTPDGAVTLRPMQRG